MSLPSSAGEHLTNRGAETYSPAVATTAASAIAPPGMVRETVDVTVWAKAVDSSFGSTSVGSFDPTVH